jgi:hypothetical protein
VSADAERGPGWRPILRRLVPPAAVATALVLAGVAVGGGCGIDTDGEPRPIDRDNVPDDLLSEAPTTGTTELDGDIEQVTVYFVRTDADDGPRLHEVERRVPRPVGEARVLEALLLSPPDGEERDEGITTAIPSTTRLADAPTRQDGGVLVLDLTEGLFGVQGDSLQLAYGQLVCTAAGIPGVGSVLFEVDGEPSAVVDGRGQSLDTPVTCEDYAELTEPAADADADGGGDAGREGEGADTGVDAGDGEGTDRSTTGSSAGGDADSADGTSDGAADGSSAEAGPVPDEPDEPADGTSGDADEPAPDGSFAVPVGGA